MYLGDKGLFRTGYFVTIFFAFGSFADFVASDGFDYFRFSFDLIHFYFL